MEFTYNFLLSFKRKKNNVDEIVYEIYNNLSDSGFKVFLDQFSSHELIGSNWKKQISKVIDKSDYYLVFMDEEYISSSTTLCEFLYIIKKENYLIIFNDNYTKNFNLVEKLKLNFPILENSIFVFKDNYNKEYLLNTIKLKYYMHINNLEVKND